MIQDQTHGSNARLELMSLGGLLWLMPDWIADVTTVLPEAEGWSVEPHVAYDGSMTVVAIHNATDQTFALSGKADQVEVVRVSEHGMSCCGVFTCLRAALDVVLREAAQVH